MTYSLLAEQSNNNSGLLLLLEVAIENSRGSFQNSPKLTVSTKPERSSDAFIVNFENILYLVPVF